MAARRGHNDSSAISGLLAPPKPSFRRDHLRENIAHLTELEEAAAVAREASAAPAPPAFKMKRFEGVPSRVAAAAAAASVPPAPPAPPAAAAAAAKRPARGASAGAERRDAARHAFLRHKEEEAPALPARYVRPEVVPRKAAVPRADDTLPLAPKSARDFVHDNVKTMVEARPLSASGGSGSLKGGAGGGATPDKHAAYGAVPAYLRARQAEWAAEAAAAAKREAEKDVPPGMRLMPEAERLETLKLLEVGIADTRDALSKFKLTVVVPSQQRRKAELEAKITQLEDAVRVFSRTRVLVKIDA